MPLDIDALRRQVPDAFVADDLDESEPDYLDVPEGQPVRIWDPNDAFGLHPLDTISWSFDGDEAFDAELEVRTGGLLRERGVDLLAWYRSYHVDQAAWGIYIREWGLSYLGRQLGGRSPLAMRALWAHEYFHFLSDVAATSIEIGGRIPIYIPYLRRDHRAWAGCRVDEALANAYALNQVGRRHGKGLLRDFMQRHPVGYRDFERYERRTGMDGLTHGYRELAAHLVDLPRPCRVRGIEAELGELLLDEVGRSVVPADVPIYFVPRVRPSLFPVVRFVTFIPAIHETRSFLKSLARLPPAVRSKWAEVKVALGRSTRDSGVKFEKLTGHDNRFSVRLTSSVRAILEFYDGEWSAIAVGGHDRAYRRAAR